MKGVKKLLIKDNSALAGVIEALLLVGLVAIILSTIQLVYIPEVMKQKETDHLDDVEKQFAQVKSVIETQSMMGVMQSDEAIAYSPMSSPLILGTKKLPYFVTSNSLGLLEIIDKEDTSDKNNEIELSPSVSDSRYINGIPLTSIRYTFYSMYQGYNTNYLYEGSGIIRNQTGGTYNTGEAMRINPAITVENISGSPGKIKIYYYITVLNCAPGKGNMQGIDLTYIRTNYTRHITHTDTLSDPDNHYIRIYSEHLDAWNKSLTDNRVGLLWEYDDRDYIDVIYKKSLNPSYIEISPNLKEIDVDFTIVELGVQLGSGTVIT